MNREADAEAAADVRWREVVTKSAADEEPARISSVTRSGKHYDSVGAFELDLSITSSIKSVKM